MNSVTECERCEAKIVESSYNPDRPIEFMRETGGGECEVDDIRLCSMCLDDVWEFVFEAEIDRSEKADPIPLERLSENVERYVGDLEDVLGQIEGHIDE